MSRVVEMWKIGRIGERGRVEWEGGTGVVD